MKTANLKQTGSVAAVIGGRRFFNAMLTVLILFATGLNSASAQGLKPDAHLPSEAEQRWIDAYVAFMQTGQYRKPLIDERRFVRVTLEPFRLEGDQFKQFDQANVGRLILQSMQQATLATGDTVAFLRMRSDQGRRTALFRVSGSDGLNYLEWYVDTRANDEVIASDCMAYTTGELLSESLRRMWLPAVAEVDPQVKKHMGRRNRELAEHLTSIQSIQGLVAAGQYEQAIRLYESLPDSVQEERLAMIGIVNAYFESADEAAYLELLDRYVALHGTAKNFELMMIDVYLFREQYDKSIEMVDGLDQRVGGDPYLDLFRSNLWHMAGDYPKAKGLLDRAIRNDPATLDYYWTAIDQALAQEDWGRVTQMLDGLQAQGQALLDLREVEGYEGYVASQAYRDWVARQGEQGVD